MIQMLIKNNGRRLLHLRPLILANDILLKPFAEVLGRDKHR